MTSSMHATRSQRIGSGLIRGGILLFGLIFFHPGSAEAQWVNAYSAGGNDVIESVAWVDAPTLGKAIAVAGYSDSFSEDDSKQAWAALIDPGGDYVWSNLYGSSALASSIAPVVDAEGLLQSLVLAGDHSGAWIMEIKPDTGSISWQCNYFYPSTTQANVVVPTNDGQFVFAGWMPDGFASALFVAKTLRTQNDPCGLEWVRVFGQGNAGDDDAASLARTSDAEFIVAGWTEPPGLRDGIVLKLSSDGTPEWQVSVSSPDGNVEFFDVSEINDETGNQDGYLAVGTFGFIDGGNDSVMAITRLEPDGSERWTRFFGYSLDGESLSAHAAYQKPDGAIVIAGSGAMDSDEPYHSRLLVFQLREDVDGEGVPTVAMEWQREMNPEAIGDNLESRPRDMTGTPGGGLIVGGYYSAAAFEPDEPLLMRINEEGDIPPDCLIEPSLVVEFHSYDFETAESPEAATPTPGVETEESTTEQELFLRYICRPCVKRVNVNIPPEMAGDGDTWDTAYTDLQDGINAAAAEIYDPTGAVGYCEVWVAQGDYYVFETDVSDTIQLMPGVHVYGGFSGGNPPESYGWEGSREDREWESNITRIIGAAEDDPADTETRTQHVVTGASISTLDGFHVIGGRANGDPGLDRWGAGMVNVFSSPKIANCTFYDNIAWWGGAMANVFAAPDVVSCTFKTSHNDPGFNQPNAAFAGGAIFNWGWAPWSGDGPTVDGCTFADNYAKYFYGGGIHNQNSPAEIVRSTFSGNHAYAGGAVSIGQTVDGMGAPSIEACTFSFNRASRWWDNDTAGLGGAMAAFFGQYVYSEYTTVENSLLDNNSTGSQVGGAIATAVLSGDPRLALLNCTIADNETGGVDSLGDDSWPTIIYNSILWNNGPYEISPDCDSGAIVYYTDVMGGAGCDGFEGNVAADPEFDPDNPFHLLSTSPCIDAANPAAAPLTDLDGEYRDPEPDMGAYEYFDGGLGD